ncbi:WhiB family transcriptional regulator [Streptomyces brevispora]|uniref:WhiB family transcriptional regulator n=1 Tax=Streptomyces brevispora TaxID=887462 RepID=UPI00371C9258
MPRPTHYGPHRSPDTLARRAHWDQRAACRYADPALFFPEGLEAEVVSKTAHAKAICRRCPVSGNCQIEALERREPFGVWGGLDLHERKAILRRAAQLAAARAAEAREAADVCAEESAA